MTPLSSEYSQVTPLSSEPSIDWPLSGGSSGMTTQVINFTKWSIKNHIFFIVETICYENNIWFLLYYNVSLNWYHQVIFSTEKQDLEKNTNASKSRM